MSSTKYKQDPLISCFVPSCKNVKWMCPNKYFFHVPRVNKAQWCAAVKKQNVPASELYICEDHLTLEEDLLNYDAWLNKNVRGRLNPRIPNLKGIELSHEPEVSAGPSSSSHLVVQQMTVNKGIMCLPDTQHKKIQIKPTMVDRSTMAIIRKKLGSRVMEKNVEVETTHDEDEFLTDNPASMQGSTSNFSETESSARINLKHIVTGRNFMLSLIEKKPMDYIGIPKKFFWIIENIEKSTKVKSLHSIITLYKIKNNDSFSRISDLFEISTTTLWRIFFKTINTLKLFFKQFCYWPTALEIKRRLPMSFKTNADYANIQCIIDCFEVEIEKPKDPVKQSLTWSQYKNCNTIKYLIGSTPYGLINFYSEGFGGRISDINICEQSGFFEVVPDKCTILADRGFKHLEAHLARKSVKVLRPPSASTDTKMTKSEVIKSKVLASLRIHIERLIRRVRLYRLLKPHAVVNNKLVSVLDDVVAIVCGLINIQSPLLMK